MVTLHVVKGALLRSSQVEPSGRNTQEPTLTEITMGLRGLRRRAPRHGVGLYALEPPNRLRRL